MTVTLDRRLEVASRYSKSSKARLAYTAHACIETIGLPGDFVECGVWKGGNVMMARWTRPDMYCWLYDTFDGMTEPGEHDEQEAHESFNSKCQRGVKWAACDVIEVFGNLLDVRAIEHEYDNIRFVAGDVRKTLLDEKNLPDAIAVLRLDTDWYDSTKIELEVLYPRLVSGGILIVDDYGHWAGARKAVDDYLGNKKKHLQPIDYTGVWMVKP